ncbi:hypothetical protein LY76DRAFT_616119 [Colletotrichum caudatum]|nr:hypothetical protein LY76DRAFT_616119 [Colletotrichum caudatum]
MGFIVQTSVIFAFIFGVALQLVLKDPIWLAFGIGNTIQPLSDFPYSCRRIENPRLQACEDMWLSEATRQLFLACSDPLARQQWMPNAAHFNASGRSTRDAIVALEIDSPKDDAFEIRTLSTPGFSGTVGDGLLQLVGLTGIDSPKGDKVQLLLVNNRPFVDPVTGELLDQAGVGANSTIEVFETGPQAVGMKHIRTFAIVNISTPNNIAALSSEAIYFTNDKGAHKVGLKSHTGPLIGQGDISFCSVSSGCKRVSQRHWFPNSLVRGRDGLIYVLSAMAGGIQKVADIPAPYSIDNLPVDGKGDIYAAVFPRGIEILQAFKDPLNRTPKSAAVRISKESEGVYAWEKVIDDGASEVLPGSTAVVHDAKTGRLFFAGVVSTFVAVCEPRN